MTMNHFNLPSSTTIIGYPLSLTIIKAWLAVVGHYDKMHYSLDQALLAIVGHYNKM